MKKEEEDKKSRSGWRLCPQIPVRDTFELQ